MARQHAPAIGVTLDLPGGLSAKAMLKPKIQTADARAQ